ncbi:MAG TPA: 2-dehydropantoate 2-reductase [Candidatus Eremiobacteraceae bacterium]|nr:2-dehydropantoate 2-reductase [Candidatus Eremiobacteraceae bacterium]
MRCLVVGAGAVGQFLAARLRLAGDEVVLLARPTALDLLNAQGVTLRSGAQEWPVGIRAAADPSDPLLAQPFDLVIVAVKAYATEEAARAIAAIAACADSVVLTVQNGIGNEDVLSAAFGRDRIVAGALTVPVERLDETVVAAPSTGGLTLAPVGAQANNWLLAVFERSGLPTRAADDWRALKWSKLLINLVANAVCAALDMTPREVYSNADAFSIERRCLREAVAVMGTAHIPAVPLVGFPVREFAWAIRTLPSGLLQLLMAGRAARARGGKLPSLLLDARAGRRHTEVRWLNGAVAALAETAGPPATANAAVTRIVAGFANGSVDRGSYSGRPDKLLTEIAAAHEIKP